MKKASDWSDFVCKKFVREARPFHTTTNTELIQSLQQAKGSLNPWMIFQQEEVDVLFIRQGCIDIQNRKVIAFDPPLSETAPKQRLRSVVSEESLSPLPLPVLIPIPLQKRNCLSPPVCLPHRMVLRG